MSSGTVYIDETHRNEKGIITTAGRVLLGQNATIRPTDFGMKTIRSAIFSPWYSAPLRFVPGTYGYRRIVSMTGSIGSLDALDLGTGAAAPVGNYMRVRTYQFWGSGAKTNGGFGTFRAGTVPGSARASYIAWGR